MAALRSHIQGLLAADEGSGFLTGQLAYSRKDKHHLRRVLVLDPFATFYLYDFVHSHRLRFARKRDVERQAFGYGFHGGRPLDGFAEYHDFRRRKYELISEHGHFAQLDIFNCFNSFYHHEVSSFVKSVTASPTGGGLGQFLRQLMRALNGGNRRRTDSSTLL